MTKKDKTSEVIVAVCVLLVPVIYVGGWEVSTVIFLLAGARIAVLRMNGE